MPVASFHLVTERPGRALVATARLGTDRPRLARTPGLRFWRLLGTGAGSDTGPGVQWGRTALFALWDDDTALDVFLGTSPIARRWADAAEAWSVRLDPVAGHGRWRGVDLVGTSGPGAVADEGPVAVVTRAVVRARRWGRFAAASRAVATEVRDADGLLRVVGIGEAPVGRQATFSLWRDPAAIESFAYGHPRHLDAVRRTRSERWYGEELFARFRPYASVGTWDGADPLAG